MPLRLGLQADLMRLLALSPALDLKESAELELLPYFAERNLIFSKSTRSESIWARHHATEKPW
jgi:hypothetical protein